MTDKRSAYNLTILYRMIIALFAGLFLTIESLAMEGVEISTPSNFVLMSSGGSSSTNATSTDGHWNNWNPGNNVWYDSNGVPYYQTVATGEVFHGTNDLLGSPIWAPVAAAGTSDFYGTASANTSSNLLGGSREYYADNFNGDFEADASGLTTSYIDIHDSNFAASKQASVTANNGTVMEMYDNNFNGNTTINAASGGTVNVQIGNSTEMQTLLSDTNDIRSLVAIIYDNISNPVVQSSATRSFTYGGKSYSYSLWQYRIDSNNIFYLNMSGRFNALLAQFATSFSYPGRQTADAVQTVLNYYGYPTVLRRREIYRYDYNPSTDVITKSMDGQYFLSFYGYLSNFFEVTLLSYIDAHIAHIADTFYRWYNPNISLANSQFWIAYNTDTGQIDHVNLSTVLYYITWYLGQLYDDGTNVTQNMQQMTQDIGTAATTFQDLNQKEQVAINQIQQGFESFLPDPTEFQSFRAITWCSNYLQQIYVALGAYGTVIFIALLFGVCLQFIGYFRYK